MTYSFVTPWKMVCALLVPSVYVCVAPHCDRHSIIAKHPELKALAAITIRLLAPKTPYLLSNQVKRFSGSFQNDQRFLGFQWPRPTAVNQVLHPTGKPFHNAFVRYCRKQR